MLTVTDATTAIMIHTYTTTPTTIPAIFHPLAAEEYLRDPSLSPAAQAEST